MSPERFPLIRAASVPLLATDGVERGPTGAPRAFRIWKAGANPTDKGVHCFTARSAKLLLDEQATRGNLYSIDVDHLSVDNLLAPPEARKAVGWHTLDARDGPNGPELWATNVEWTEAVRSGLESSPPEWRYVSAAYNINKASGEIVSYHNLALTNNPAAWQVTALASRAIGDRGVLSTVEDLGHGAVRASRLPPKEHEELAARMGRDARPKGIHWDPDHPNDLVFPLMNRDEARAFLASRRRDGAR
ncbi:MAG: phage protease [Myxococcota bacterium]|nr:phage protease [Myxococcota bacterium]